LGRTMVPGVCTARVPTAGDDSVHMASCTPGGSDGDLLLCPFDDGRATAKKDGNHAAKSGDPAFHGLAP
jgi:hypothetical protein